MFQGASGCLLLPLSLATDIGKASCCVGTILSVFGAALLLYFCTAEYTLLLAQCGDSLCNILTRVPGSAFFFFLTPHLETRRQPLSAYVDSLQVKTRLSFLPTANHTSAVRYQCVCRSDRGAVLCQALARRDIILSALSALDSCCTAVVWMCVCACLRVHSLGRGGDV